MKVPFSVYDFFAYLASGVVILAALDGALGSGALLTSDMTVGASVVVLVAAYVAGQLIAQVSSTLLEAWGVARLLGRPSDVLFGGGRRGFRLLFPGYFRELPAETQERVRRRATEQGFTGNGEALFIHAYGSVTKEGSVQERLDSFRNLYGFARNMAVALGLAAGLAAYGIWGLGKDLAAWIPWVSGSAAVGMLYRYLKFFRQFSYQLFLVYAERGGGD